MKIANFDKSVNGVKTTGTHVITCEVKGLELWVTKTKTGLTKTFRLRYRSNGKQPRITLGKYPILSLKDAKHRAIKFLNDLELNGVDPVEKDRLGSFKNYSVKWITRKMAIAEEMEKSKKIIRGAIKKKTCVSYESALRLHCKPLHDIHIMDITEEDINIVVENVESTKSAALAHKVRSSIASMYNEIVATSPLVKRSPVTAASTVHISTEDAGQNPLKNEQIKELWQRIIKIDPIRRGLIKFALYTGMRKNNLEYMEWQEVNEDCTIWTIPAHKFKGTRSHAIPLSIQSQEILKEMKQHKDKSGIYVFPFRTSKTPKNPSRLHEALESFNMGFTSHAFRKTVYTIMKELRTDQDIIKACVGHQYKEDDLEKTYNRDNVRRNNGTTVLDGLRMVAYQEYADEIDRIILGHYDNQKNGVKRENMISIVNISKELKEKGKHEYALKINGRMITTFEHNREEKLSVCLMRAAKAVEKMEKEKE